MRFFKISWAGTRVNIPIIIVLLFMAILAREPARGDSVPAIVRASNQKPLVIGHRGTAALAPENTLAAFTHAIELGVDAVELDVLLSADGQLVVHHDFTLNPEIARTSDGQWVDESQRTLIKELTIDQIKTYDVGRLKPGSALARRYPDQQPVDGERIPTLREVIGLLKQKAAPDLFLCIEIKTSPEKPDMTPPPETVADAVVRVVRSENFAPRTKILSFDWRSLVRIQETAPEIPTVYLTSQFKQFKPFGKAKTLLWTAGFDPADYDGSLPKMIRAAGGRHWAAKYSQITADHVRRAHEAGIMVYVWTVDSKSDMTYLIRMGVDGIITNRPDLLCVPGSGTQHKG
jgi:glycerophosphoryl diester phosphodiesterase